MTKKLGLLLLAVAAVALTLATADDAQAFGRRGGSSGSSGASYGQRRRKLRRKLAAAGTIGAAAPMAPAAAMSRIATTAAAAVINPIVRMKITTAITMMAIGIVVGACVVKLVITATTQLTIRIRPCRAPNTGKAEPIVIGKRPEIAMRSLRDRVR